MPTLFTEIYTITLNNGLLVDEIAHGLVAAPFVALMIYKSKSLKLGLFTFLVAYFIDVDHFIDFWLARGFSLDLIEFFSIQYFDEAGRAMVLFHGWEYMLFFGYLGFKKNKIKNKWHSPFTAISMGMLPHLIWDSHTVGSVIFYSIIYRISTGFALPG